MTESVHTNNHVRNPAMRINKDAPGLRPTFHLVGIYLMYEGESTIRDVAEALGRTYTQVRTAIWELEQAGLVDREPHTVQKGTGDFRDRIIWNGWRPER